MTRAALLALAIGCSAAATTPPANRVAQKADTTKTVSLPLYGDITIADGEIALMDHNNGDGRVHVMRISRDAGGTKLSWADRGGPRSDVNTDTFPISADERVEIRSWSQAIWQLAPNGRRLFPKAENQAKPYEWTIVMRRGEDVRVVAGGASDSQPDRIEEAVDFLDMHF